MQCQSRQKYGLRPVGSLGGGTVHAYSQCPGMGRRRRGERKRGSAWRAGRPSIGSFVSGSTARLVQEYDRPCERWIRLAAWAVGRSLGSLAVLPLLPTVVTRPLGQRALSCQGSRWMPRGAWSRPVGAGAMTRHGYVLQDKWRTSSNSHSSSSLASCENALGVLCAPIPYRTSVRRWRLFPSARKSDIVFGLTRSRIWLSHSPRLALGR